jgi:isopentenyl-diphosphate Delta-isomerase
MKMKQDVILVNENDEEAGFMEKMEVHRKGLLHRAFSVFIFDKNSNMLLQQRAAGKYHGAHLWTNACCSHPFPGEPVATAAARRLKEELGFTASLEKIFDFIYRSEVENNLVEHEFDHVFTGIYEGEIIMNPEEVEAVRYVSMDEIKEELKLHPERFTIWFRIAFPRIIEWLGK